uniref:NADH:ubiquinone reductase (H(+)-translocating) n=1 Tax=Placozoa sp. H2 TaxID=573895 RepID=A0A7I6N5Y7_9METZ|nr:NADH dehydrogenase subunit 2 [Placozoa sp. H2 HM-2017]
MNSPRDLLEPMISIVTQFTSILVITFAIFIILLRGGRHRPIKGRWSGARRAPPPYLYIAFFATFIAFFFTIWAPLAPPLHSPSGTVITTVMNIENDVKGPSTTFDQSAPMGPFGIQWIRAYGAGLAYGAAVPLNLFDIVGGAFGADRAPLAPPPFSCEILGLRGGESAMVSAFGMVKENSHWASECVILLSLMGLLFLTNQRGPGSGFALVLIVGLGGLLLIESANWLTIYLALELQTLALFILACESSKDSNTPPESGLKYWILGAMSSGFYLFGCALYFGFTGNEGMLGTILSATLETTNIELRQGSLGYLFITVAILFKLAAAPFHMWTPDVYEGAPTPTTALIAIIPKFTVYILLTSLVITSKLLLSVAIISLVVGAFGALNQTRIKRLLAYSGIGHMGFILIGVSAGTYESLQNSWTYAVTYLVSALASFTVICTLEEFGTRATERRRIPTDPDPTDPIRRLWRLIPRRLRRIADFSILSRGQPYIAFSLAIVFLSLAGIPPLLGFLGKWFILVGTIKVAWGGYGAFGAALSIYYLVALLAIICTCISAFYYIRIVATIYFNFTRPLIKTKTPLSFILTWESILKGGTSEAEPGGGKSILISIYMYFILFLIICPQPLLLISYEAMPGA